MANPAPAPPQGSLQDRVLRLAQTLQFGWFVGHVSMLFFTLQYGIKYITFKTWTKWAGFSYRTAFLSAIVTYGIVVYKSYRARIRQGKPTTPFALVQDENVQYLLMACIWVYAYQVPLALLPFVVYSIFHVATYVRSNIIPTISPAPAAANTPTSPLSPKPGKPTGAVAETIGKFIKEYYDSSMMLVAWLEIGLLGRLLLSCFTFAKGTWVLFVVYVIFFRARYAQSSFVQGALAGLGARGDAAFGNQASNPQARQAWETFKGVLKQVEQATDLGRYANKGAAPAGAKKAQ